MSVTSPAGFRAAGVIAGLKESGTPDLALVINDGPQLTAASVFTRNRVKAAPVLWSAQVLATATLRSVILNSGGANACTGPEGFADTHATAEQVAAELGIGAIDVAVCSTGLIGVRLDMDKISSAVPGLVAAASTDGGPAAAQAIMTTDTHAKQVVVAGDGWSVGGMAKGAAMLAPSLATMLVVLTTDAVVEPPVLDRALRTACGQSFDRVDSDGCMSTNDTVIVMASGASQITPTEAEITTVLTTSCQDLARQLIGDAEGAAHDIAITVAGAASEADALTVGRSIARNNLLKCAIYGNDPNWGRVLAAIGTTDAVFEPDELDVSFNGVKVCVGGGIGAPRNQVDLTARDTTILVDLPAGTAEATIWTNDLTYDYVKENAEYST
ncbi:MAG: bifunctional glutamate N-acetyltransferase/amino-acid acetyltransferase ArgJ [Propionibacteriaceae bacterium]